MFSQKLGAKLDFGYNRASNDDNSPDFKFNYTRVNAQLVYDLTNNLSFMIPQDFALVSHLGPGISFTKPLANYSNNKHTFINAMAEICEAAGGDVTVLAKAIAKDKAEEGKKVLFMCFNRALADEVEHEFRKEENVHILSMWKYFLQRSSCRKNHIY